MITHGTASGAPTNIANSGRNDIVLFGYQSQSRFSPKFTVDQMPYFLSAFNLASTDTVTVLQLSVDGTETAVFAPVFGALQLTSNTTKIRIDYPGVYQLEFAGSTPLGQFTVNGYAATMTDDNLSGLAQALTKVIAADQITGTLPVIVTASGPSNTGPFVISFETDYVTGSGGVVVTGGPNGPYNAALNTIPGSAPPNFVEVTASDPVAVSGNGTAATPYLISTPNIEVQNAGLNNIVIGKGATSTNISGSSVCIGANCTVTSPNGIALGQSAASNGTSDIVIGLHAATSSSSTGGNVCIGTNTGFNAAGIIANRNIILGNPGAITFSATGTFSSNVILGNQSGLGSGGSFSNAVLIGGGGAFPGSNQIVIGNGGPSTNGGASVSIGAGAGANTNFNNCVAIGYNAANSGQSGLYIGYEAGSGNTFANCIALSNSPSTALVPTQANQALLGDSTITQLVTAGSIIQAGAISASDERLKKNVKQEEDALSKLEELAPVTFSWDKHAILQANVPMNEDEYGKLQHGLLAQEVEPIFPELIENVNRGFGEYKFVRYERLIPILISAIQELSIKVKELESR